MHNAGIGSAIVWWMTASVCVLALSLSPVVRAAGEDMPAAGHTSPGAAVQPAPERRIALFGELHLHTSWSFDAFSFSPARIDPAAAYRFGRGEAVDYLGKPARRHAPLDFMAVTDHAEYMGFLNTIEDPHSELSRSAFADEYRRMKATLDAATLSRELQKRLMDPVQMRELNAAAAFQSTWQRVIEAANANYRPGEFTTFIGYEWTSHPDDRYNLHRNVIFAGDSAPLPFSAADSKRPEDLWRYLEDSRAHGYRVLAIPHNANASEGFMFDWNDSDGRPIDAAYAQRRALNEPLLEIYQSKGQSETVPMLSPNDEFADFEVMDRLVPRLDLPGKPPGSYARDALGRGLLIEQRTGQNPFRFGMVGGTDFHNGLTTSAENAAVMADGFDAQRAPDLEASRAYLAEPSATIPDAKLFGSGGLTGVWAETNTRDAIFAALQRRETFATSGTRIRLRLFAGWNYAPGLLGQRDWLERAYADGVPMGSDLPVSLVGAAPVFLMWAAKAPDGANLDRAQIVKVWLDGDTAKEQVFDVALSDGRVVDPASGRAPRLPSTVDLEKGTYEDRVGAAELTAYWQDPAFDPRQSAVYYLRVLEIETPRWTTLMAARTGLPRPQTTAATVQERAWSSPIWYRAQASR